MKKRFFLKTLPLILFCILLMPKTSFSQLIFGGGVSLPSNPTAFSETYKTGFNLEFAWLFGTSIFSNTDFEFGISFDSFGLSIPEGSDISGGGLTIGTMKIGARYYLDDPIVGKSNFYLAAGYGRYNMSTTDLKSENFTLQFEEQLGNSINFGIGVIMPNHFFTNFDLRYTTIYTDGAHNLSFVALRMIIM